MKHIKNTEKIMGEINFVKVPFFHGLDEDKLEELKPKLEVVEYENGEVLFREGEPGDCLYIIIKGNVKVFAKKKKGGTQELARLGKNESFGEMALLSYAPRSASIKAITELIVLKLSKENFDEVAKNNNLLAVHFAGLLAKRSTSTKHEVYEPKLSPREVHASMEQSGASKANKKVWQLFFLAILAGVYISFGGHAFMVALDQGAGKIVGGAVFSVGLILVVIAEAELFTGNIIMMVGLLSSLFQFKKLLKNFVAVYVGNFFGSFMFTLAIYETGLFGDHLQPSGLGQIAIKVAEAKMSLTFFECFVRGVFCNMLVVLAVIMTIFAKDVISKIFCCIVPVMVFVASGFEHCVANMYLIPIGLLSKCTPLIEHYTILYNIIPVTLGNIVGGLLIIFLHPYRIGKIFKRFKAA